MYFYLHSHSWSLHFALCTSTSCFLQLYYLVESYVHYYTFTSHENHMSSHESLMKLHVLPSSCIGQFCTDRVITPDQLASFNPAVHCSSPLTICCCSTGFSFDLSPLSKANGGFYNISSKDYEYYINVCGNVAVANCPEKAGACQVNIR